MVDIVAIGVHPDDIEFGVGGILAKMASQGKSIVMVDLTLGEKGSRGDPETRRKEGEKSASLIGAKRIFLDFKDCEVSDTYEGRLKLVKVIREYKPRLVLAPTWYGVENHPDHTACGLLARNACRFARFAKILPDIPIHWVDGILHCPPLNTDKVDFIIDVSDYVDTWREMMRCHASQIANFDYDIWNLRSAAKWGMLMGVPFAQALVKGNPIVIDDVMEVAKSTREL